MLVLDGVIQYTERDECSYQEMIAHIPMFTHKEPKRVLVVGGGDGGVMACVLKHESVEEVVLCEIDQLVMDVSEKFFDKLKPAWKDKRLTINCGDAAEYMERVEQDSFDVIICDTSDPDGPANSLFGPEFYKNMHRALRPGGVICTQAESIWLHLPLVEELVKNAKQFYPFVDYAITNVPTYPCGSIGLLVAKKQDETNSVTDCNAPVRPIPLSMLSDLKFYTRKMHVGAFARPSFVNESIQPLLNQ